MYLMNVLQLLCTDAKVFHKTKYFTIDLHPFTPRQHK